MANHDEPDHNEYGNNSDEYGFWNDAPVRRRHAVTRAIPVVTGPAPDPGDTRVEAWAGTGPRHIDPLIRRVGALALLIAMCVPVAVSLKDGGSSVAAMKPVPSGTVPTSALGEPATLPEATAPQTSATQPGAPAAMVGAASTQTTPTQPEPVTAVVTVPVCAKEYSVVASDYWILIAKKVSVGLNELLDANNATTDTALYPGRTICLPANASAPTTAAPATVAAPANAAAPATRAPATTAAPTTTTAAPTTTVPVRTSYTRAEVEAIIREIWPDDLENEAVRIATRESNLLPTAQNFCCYGLFQIYWNVHKGWLAGIGVTSSQQLFDPRVNAWAALVLYNRAGGWGPWT
jgi:LysM repeat protein